MTFEQRPKPAIQLSGGKNIKAERKTSAKAKDSPELNPKVELNSAAVEQTG